MKPETNTNHLHINICNRSLKMRPMHPAADDLQSFDSKFECVIV